MWQELPRRSRSDSQFRPQSSLVSLRVPEKNNVLPELARDHELLHHLVLSNLRWEKALREESWRRANGILELRRSHD